MSPQNEPPTAVKRSDRSEGKTQPNNSSLTEAAPLQYKTDSNDHLAGGLWVLKSSDGRETGEQLAEDGLTSKDLHAEEEQIIGRNATLLTDHQGEQEYRSRSDPISSGDEHRDIYLDPTPKTPRHGVSPTREIRSGDGGVEDGTADSTSEIRSIMSQFSLDQDEKQKENMALPGIGKQPAGLDGGFDRPPRTSSLETRIYPTSASKEGASSDKDVSLPQSCLILSSEKQTQSSTFIPPDRISSLPQITKVISKDDSLPPPPSPASFSKALPVPDPEPDLPFDFHRFLEQLRHKTADPVAKYLRSFLNEFGRKQWMVYEQTKLISDFLTFITNKMARCEIWRGVSDAEFDNAKEGMEKLVMNRLYSQTFSPAIPPPVPIHPSRGKRRNEEILVEPGRRGHHQEDIERDAILAQKVKIYGWVQEEHLDIPRVDESGRKFLILAQQELLKIKSYRAPRDKVICVLNCCKVIFGILRKSKTSDTSADAFVPLLIYVVLHANPEHLVSNVQYILRFRNPDKLNGEAGYYLSSLMGAIQFIENIDRTSLTVSDQDFEKNVEAAVSNIAEKHPPEPMSERPASSRMSNAPHISEKSTLSKPEVVPRNSVDAEYSSPRKSPALQGDSTFRNNENSAVSGLLKTIQRPLNSIGRIFSDEPDTLPNHSEPPAPQRLSPSVFQPPRDSSEMIRPPKLGQQSETQPESLRSHRARKMSAEDAAASQANAEAAEAQRIQQAEHQNIVE